MKRLAELIEREANSVPASGAGPANPAEGPLDPAPPVPGAVATAPGDDAGMPSGDGLPLDQMTTAPAN